MTIETALLGLVDAEEVEFDETARVYTIRRRPALPYENVALTALVDGWVLRHLTREAGVRYTPVVRVAAEVPR